MTIRVRPVRPDETEAFENFLMSAHADFLQTPAWASVKAAFGWTPHHLWLEEDRTPVGAVTFLEKGLLGNRSVLYAPRGPVVPPDARYFMALSEYIRSWPGRRRPLWARVDPDVATELGDETRLALGRASFCQAPDIGPFGGIQPRRVYRVDLLREPLFEGLPGKTRYNVRLARRKGISVRVGGPEDVGLFHRLLRETGLRQGFTVRSRLYYERVYKALNGRGLGELLLAERDGDLLAANWVIHFGDRSSYLYGASKANFQNLMASYLIQWEAIRRSRRRGSVSYDLLGVPLSDVPGTFGEGLRTFKSHFGEMVELVGEFDLPLNPWLYQLFRLLSHLLKGWPRSRDGVRKLRPRVAH